MIFQFYGGHLTDECLLVNDHSGIYFAFKEASAGMDWAGGGHPVMYESTTRSTELGGMRPAGDKDEACESAAKRGPSVTVSRLPALVEGRPWGPAALSEPPARPPASVKPWAAHCPLRGGLHYLQTPAVPLFALTVFIPRQSWEARLSCTSSYRCGSQGSQASLCSQNFLPGVWPRHPRLPGP